jgi:hypothetical protein
VKGNSPVSVSVVVERWRGEHLCDEETNFCAWAWISLTGPPWTSPFWGVFQQGSDS